MRAFQTVGLWLLVCGVLAACDPGVKGKSRDASTVAPDATPSRMEAGTSPEVNTTLKGRVFDAETGRALEGAELKSGDGASAKTDAKGSFELEVGAASKELKVSRPSYAPSSKEAPMQGGYVEVFLKDVDKSVEFNGKDGVSLKLDSGASVDVPSGSVRDAKGKEVTGRVTLELTEIDGQRRMQASALPGEMKAQSAAGKEGRASIQSALEIRMRDEKGNDLTVTEGKVTADLPIRDSDPPSKRDVFSYDEKRGAWVEEGKAERVTRGDGKVVYRAKIKHLSWWSYADFFSELTCLRACAQDGAKKPVAGAQVWIVGASHPGVASMFSGDDGCAATDTIAGARVVLVAQAEAGISGAQSHVTTSEIHLVKDGVSGCDDGGTLVLGDAPTSDCAHGFASCGGVCAELATDASHCGSCARTCADTERCLLGRCSGDAVVMDGGTMTLPDAGPTVDAGSDASTPPIPDAGPAHDAGMADSGIMIPVVDAGPIIYGNPSPGLVGCGAQSACGAGGTFCCADATSYACSAATCPVNTQACDGIEDCTAQVCCMMYDVDLDHRYGECATACGGPNLPACHTNADCPFNSVCGDSGSGAGVCSPKT